MSLPNEMMKLAKEITATGEDPEVTLLEMVNSGYVTVFYDMEDPDRPNYVGTEETVRSISVNGPALQLNVGRSRSGRGPKATREMLKWAEKMVRSGKVTIWNKETRRLDDATDVFINGHALEFSVEVRGKLAKVEEIGNKPPEEEGREHEPDE